MSNNQVKQPQNDLLNTLTNAGGNQHKPPSGNTTDNDQDDNDQLIEREQIPNTPFWIIGNKTDGYYLVMGKYRLTEVKNTKEEVKTHLLENIWHVILSMIIAVNDANTKQNVDKL